ncbi:unnamed protein product [Dicrocoelium dendriticum]|nr:unnamed protein product [Dicrocoelium dendriticum]
MLIASLQCYVLIVLASHSLMNLCAASGNAAPERLPNGHRRIRPSQLRPEPNQASDLNIWSPGLRLL